MKRLVTFCLAAVFALVGCSGAKPNDVYRNTPDPAGYTPPENPVTLKIGHVPGLEMLPLWIAEQRDYFSAEGVNVELVPYDSAAERDRDLTQGLLDGIVTDMIAAISLYGQGHPVQIGALALGVTPEEGPVGIVVTAGSAVGNVEQLKGVEIAVALNSVTHYAAEKMLLENGVTSGEITLVSVPSAAERLVGLFTGEVQASVLSEPDLTDALVAGAKLIVTDARAKHNYSQSVVLFHKEAIDQKADGIKRFFRGFNKGAAMTQLSPSGYHDVLTANGVLAEELQGAFRHPPHSLAQLPREGDVERAVEWLFQRQIIKSKPTYEQLVNTSVLP